MQARLWNKENGQPLNKAVANDPNVCEVYKEPDGTEAASRFDHVMTTIIMETMAKRLSIIYLNKELDEGSFLEEELLFARCGVYVQSSSMILEAFSLHSRGLLRSISCTPGGHVYNFIFKQDVCEKVEEELHSYDGMTIEDLFSELHETFPTLYSSEKRERVLSLERA